jgi:FAD/FMN-containing dehydrogenase
MLARAIKTWAINIANSAVFLFTRGRRVLHEGRFRNGQWSDWYRVFHCRPKAYLEPESEEEICRLVAEARKVRVVGAGHSFNSAPLSDDLLLSLDRLNHVEVRDDPERPGWKIAQVQAGIRLRDLHPILLRHGVGLAVAGSTHAQSIGGLLATDVHGTGRDHGFLSESLLSLRMVDARGRARTFRPGDEVFHAAIGGAGACGVIVGAEILCEPAYNLAKAVKVVPRQWAEENLDALLQENTHLSFYYFAGLLPVWRLKRKTDEEREVHIRMNKWNRTVERPDLTGGINKMVSELFDMIFSGHLIGLARVFNLADFLAAISLFIYKLAINHQSYVYPSGDGFARTLYFRHDEIEYGLEYDREKFIACMKEIRDLMNERAFPTIIEVRFTPDNSKALIGPGVGRRTVYIELAPSTSRESDQVFREFEEIIVRKYGGRPHLGKKMYLDQQGMETAFGEKTMRCFRAVRQCQDPEGKFLNPFTENLLA